MNFKGRLELISPATFEAKRARQDPYSHDCRTRKHKTSTQGLSRLWAKGPANFVGEIV